MSPMPPRVARKRSALLPGRALDDAAVRHAHAQGEDVAAEAAVAVVVLAVDVGRHHAAQGDELRAGSDGGEEAARQEEAVELEEREARPPRAGRPWPGRRTRMRSASGVPATTGWPGGGSEESP